ncbi:MAG: DNA repair protein RadC [Bacteroidales bacterium]|nr:DNA repair protein RadC [Bacteroidales bacterium]
MEGFFYFMQSSTKKNTIKEWAYDDRPREKLLSKGVQTLSNTELLAILIRTGTNNYNAVELARKLLQEANNNLNTLATFNIEKYKKISGLGSAKAVTIMAALELGNRRNLESALEVPVFSNSQKVFDFFRSIFADMQTEQAWFVTLNNANKLKGYYQLSSGGQTATVIDIRVILKKALYDDATAIILAHNHPSGNLKPSEQDKIITQKLKLAAQQLDIQLLDHIIITQYKYFSFADEGLL